MSANTFQRSGTLTAAAVERLLQALDPDRDRAAAAYEQLRERVAGLMQWWGASLAAELADETLDRVARKLESGTVIREGSLGAYVRGVARLVYYEAARSRVPRFHYLRIAISRLPIATKTPSPRSSVSMNVCRLRAFRLRERLERCVSACLGPG